MSEDLEEIQEDGLITLLTTIGDECAFEPKELVQFTVPLAACCLTRTAE